MCGRETLGDRRTPHFISINGRLRCFGCAIARAVGQMSSDFPRYRIFGPLGMADTDFHLPEKVEMLCGSVGAKTQRFSDWQAIRSGGLTALCLWSEERKPRR
jgi:hypothetical protein